MYISKPFANLSQLFLVSFEPGFVHALVRVLRVHAVC